ncbi:MAG: peptide chain release factor N(5)-glutamine methyltransferase [Myxococcota bacterium]
MNIRNTLQQAAQALHTVNVASARLDVELLLAHVLQTDRVGLYGRLSQQLNAQQQQQFTQLLQRRLAHEPMAYLLGHREFYGIDIAVTPAVLAPRPETELLVEQALQHLPQNRPSVVIDVCTGSGCIAISIALHRPQATVWAIDMSQEALQVAQHNARAHGLQDRLRCVHGDLLQPCQHMRHVDCIVANPPYIRRQEFAQLPDDVRLYEPEQALVGECADGLGHHRRILSQAGLLLRPGGCVLLEISPYQQQASCLQGNQLHNLQILQDSSGFSRLLIFVKKRGD